MPARRSSLTSMNDSSMPTGGRVRRPPSSIPVRLSSQRHSWHTKAASAMPATRAMRQRGWLPAQHAEHTQGCGVVNALQCCMLQPPSCWRKLRARQRETVRERYSGRGKEGRPYMQHPRVLDTPLVGQLQPQSNDVDRSPALLCASSLDPERRKGDAGAASLTDSARGSTAL